MDLYTKAKLLWYTVKNWIFFRWQPVDIALKLLIILALVFVFYKRPQLAIVIVVIFLGGIGAIWILGFLIPNFINPF